MIYWVFLAVSIFIATIFLTILDIYPKTKSLLTLFAPSYYFLLVILFLFNLLAAWLLINEIKIFTLPDDFVKILIFATFGTLSVIQSFSLRFGDFQLINISEMIDSFKISVLEDTAAIQVNKIKIKIQKTAIKLNETIEDEKLLFTEYITTIERELQSIDEEIEKLKQFCSQRGLNFKRLLCQRIAQADLDKAKELIKTYQSE